MTMPKPFFDVALPMLASADPATIACALDRLADLALSFGRAAYAEHLAQRAADLRERGQ
jgi:hypothetical protein